EGVVPLLEDIEVRLRHRLTLQAHGFEGLGPHRVLASSDDLAVLNGVDDRIPHVYRNTVALPYAARVLHHHDLISRLDELLRLVTGFIKHLQPLPEVTPHRFLSREDTNVVGRTLDCPPVDVWMPEVHQPVNTLRVERLQRLAHDLHVRVRHRLLLEAEVGESAVAVHVDKELHHLAVADVE